MRLSGSPGQHGAGGRNETLGGMFGNVLRALQKAGNGFWERIAKRKRVKWARGG